MLNSGPGPLEGPDRLGVPTLSTDAAQNAGHEPGRGSVETPLGASNNPDMPRGK